MNKNNHLNDTFLNLLAAPARRALENKGIKTLIQLSKYSTVEILKLHGIGASTIPVLKKALQEKGLTFKVANSDEGSKNVIEYIKNHPEKIQLLLDQLRTVIKKNAPDAEESINYAMPAYKLNGKPLVYFAAFKNHIGFYATPTGHTVFKKELSKYKQGKGSVQFPVDKPLPIDLIKKIVIFRVKENLEKKE
jgi:uncharacterized protein YdhG (YjbR/CyaY superfamily)